MYANQTVKRIHFTLKGALAFQMVRYVNYTSKEILLLGDRKTELSWKVVIASAAEDRHRLRQRMIR